MKCWVKQLSEHIDVVKITKAMSVDVKDKLEVAAETELKINTAQEEYRPLAARRSIRNVSNIFQTVP